MEQLHFPFGRENHSPSRRRYVSARSVIDFLDRVRVEYRELIEQKRANTAPDRLEKNGVCRRKINADHFHADRIKDRGVVSLAIFQVIAEPRAVNVFVNIAD